MSFGTTILLATLSTALAEMMTKPDSDCDYMYTVSNEQMVTVNNPQWPDLYRQNRICRWVFSCPTGYNCRLRCNFISLPKSHNCGMDRLLVSRVGSLQLVGAKVYCGRAVIDMVSVYQRITIGLITSSHSPGGRFTCTATTV